MHEWYMVYGMMNDDIESVIECCVDEWKKRGSFGEMVLCFLCFLSD